MEAFAPPSLGGSDLAGYSTKHPFGIIRIAPLEF